MKKDIFDQITFDIFDKLEDEKPSKVKFEVITPEKKPDIFDRIKKELPAILKQYIKPDKKEIELSDEIIKLVRDEVAQIKVPEKLIERVTEKVVVKPEIKQVTVDAESRKSVEALRKEVEKLREELASKKETNQVWVAKSPLPDPSGHSGQYLTNEATANGPVFKWATVSQGADGVLYLGDSTADGSWRIIIDGDNLAFQKRISGSWVEKGAMVP